MFYNFTCYQCGPFCGINKATKGAELMPEIIPIRDLKNTNAISQRCHETQEPIFVTKSGYGDMVIMSIRAPRMLSGEFLFMATPHNSRLTMRVPQPDIIEHFGNADAVPQPPERCLSRKAGIMRCCLKHKAPARTGLHKPAGRALLLVLSAGLNGCPYRKGCLRPWGPGSSCW